MLLKYTLVWLGMMMLAVLNGGVRDVLYKSHVGELTAHQISTASLLAALAGYFWLLDSIWPLQSPEQAWTIGLIWLVMTLAFETLLGRLVLKHSWSRMLQDYNFLAGRVWLLIPAWVLVGPYVTYRLRIGM